jgi:ribosomal protein uS13
MARIAGINIPPQKHAEIGLTAIFGIGRSRARKICEACGIEYSKKVKDLTDGDLEKIRDQIAQFTIEGDLRRETTMNIKRLMDIGCYCISLSRFLFEAEPQRVMGIVEYDPTLKVDRLASAILDFGAGTSTWTCSTQLVPYQRVNVFGTEGRIEIEIPFNAPPDRPCKMWHQRGTKVEEIVLEIVDQYTIQGDLFSRAVLEDKQVPTPLEDAVANMKVIEAVVRSQEVGLWVKP